MKSGCSEQSTCMQAGNSMQRERWGCRVRDISWCCPLLNNLMSVIIVLHKQIKVWCAKEMSSLQFLEYRFGASHEISQIRSCSMTHYSQKQTTWPFLSEALGYVRPDWQLHSSLVLVVLISMPIIYESATRQRWTGAWGELVAYASSTE